MKKMPSLLLPAAAFGLLALLVTAVPAAAQASAAELARGKAQFARCAACHAITANGPKKIGPHLQGIVGRPAGKQAGVRYSAPMAQSDIVWTPAKLDEFIAKPRAIVPGTAMVFAGISDPAARTALVAYLAAQQ